MTLVTKFQLGYKLDDSQLQPGDIYRDEADVLWEVKPDGSRVELGAGGGSMTLEQVLTAGNDGGGLSIENIADPSSDQDAATKAYVDDHGSGLPSWFQSGSGDPISGSVVPSQIGAIYFDTTTGARYASLDGATWYCVSGNGDTSNKGLNVNEQSGSINAANGLGPSYVKEWSAVAGDGNQFEQTQVSDGAGAIATEELLPGSWQVNPNANNYGQAALIAQSDGADGVQILMSGLPDSDPGQTGQLYTLAGALMVSGS